MSHLLNLCHSLLWYNYNVIWWSNKYDTFHNSGDICQRFTKGFIRWIIIYKHWYKLNITALVFIERYPYRILTKLCLFFTHEICGNILNILWGGIRTKTCLYTIRWKTWRCMILLEILVFLRLCIVLGISDNYFTEDKAHGMWRILNGGYYIYHYHYIFGI